jgi:IPT/TIG domain
MRELLMTTLRNLAVALMLFAALVFSGSARTDGIMSGPCIGCGEGIINVGAGTACPSTPTVTALSPTSGTTAGGTPVTVTGTNFTGATAVNFGGTPAASFSVGGPTSITATSPAGTGTVDVRVTQCAISPINQPGDQYTFTTPPSYVGSGDIAAFNLWGSPAFAYTATYAAAQGPMLDLVDTLTGLATCTLSVGTNGQANLSAVACPTGAPVVSTTTFCTVTHTGCSIAKVYDQTGGGSHWTQATLAKMPLLNLSGITGNPTIQCVGSASTIMSTGATVSNGGNPWSYVAVAERTANFTTTQAIMGSIGGGGGNNQIGFNNVASTALMFGPLVTLSSVADSAPHKISGTFAATSTLNVDGSAASGGAASNAFTSTVVNLCAFTTGQNFFTGLIGEAGLLPGAYNAAVYTNAGIRWGF